MGALLWWGYVHQNGGVQAKRWHPSYGQAEIDDAHQSPFVVSVVEPFEARNRDIALEIIAKKTGALWIDECAEISQEAYAKLI